jgi:hypothetical protein
VVVAFVKCERERGGDDRQVALGEPAMDERDEQALGPGLDAAVVAQLAREHVEVELELTGREGHAISSLVVRSNASCTGWRCSGLRTGNTVEVSGRWWRCLHLAQSHGGHLQVRAVQVRWQA